MVGILKYAITTTTGIPRVQIISLLDSFKKKKVSEPVEAVYTFIFLFQK